MKSRTCTEATPAVLSLGLAAVLALTLESWLPLVVYGGFAAARLVFGLVEAGLACLSGE